MAGSDQRFVVANLDRAASEGRSEEKETSGDNMGVIDMLLRRGIWGSIGDIESTSGCNEYKIAQDGGMEYSGLNDHEKQHETMIGDAIIVGIWVARKPL